MYSSPDYHMSSEGQLFILVLACGVFSIWHFAKKRNAEPTGAMIALKLGLSFSSKITRTIQPRLAFINRLQYGKKHYACNVFSGTFRGYRVRIFDFIYEVEVMNGRSGSYIDDPYSFFVLDLPVKFDEVTIYKEGILSKLKQMAGANDIDFESHEFSRKFRVRSSHPKLAYDFCNPRMMEFLIENTDISIELDRDILCMSFDRALKFEEVEKNLLRLVHIRSLMPAYLFKE